MYGKFFSSTFTGSMFGAGCEVFSVWGFVIANTIDSHVELNPAMLAATLGTTPDKVIHAINFLCQPDPRSRNPEEDGRRLIHEGSFQYRVVSHSIYRKIRNEEERREYNRMKQRESRERRKSNDMSLTVNDSQSQSTMSAHTEAEAETYTETKKAKPSRAKREGDVRFTPFRQAIASFWVSKNMNEMPWGASDAAQLSRMLRENPKLTEESFRQMLQNRFNSQCNPSQRVHAWIGRITDFAVGPLDRFKQPVNYKPTPSPARPISILDEIRRTRGIEHAAN